MPELILIAHALVALLCAIEIRVSLGNRERMNHLLRDNWNRRQEGRDLLREARAIANGHDTENLESQSDDDFTEPD